MFSHLLSTPRHVQLYVSAQSGISHTYRRAEPGRLTSFPPFAHCCTTAHRLRGSDRDDDCFYISVARLTGHVCPPRSSRARILQAGIIKRSGGKWKRNARCVAAGSRESRFSIAPLRHIDNKEITAAAGAVDTFIGGNEGARASPRVAAINFPTSRLVREFNR